MIKELQLVNADTGVAEHFELHEVDKDKRGKVRAVKLFQNGELDTYTKTGNALFYSDRKTVSIPRWVLEEVR
ncbi:hypothetical protein [Lacicoccus qingdaonensis]|uniref:Uncharacterized protein n=1 Tax=Lacicoccus qingdaonensis TaxID=576118 RepID=A0A1G9EZW2_9BACL|nr:hypothetical protein [Salinicoccus qingdaonensis]SDK81573.1 hypothetical protein SAMN05216216_11063 [Salinicoccus qingdaonensis]